MPYCPKHDKDFDLHDVCPDCDPTGCSPVGLLFLMLGHKPNHPRPKREGGGLNITTEGN